MKLKLHSYNNNKISGERVFGGEESECKFDDIEKIEELEE